MTSTKSGLPARNQFLSRVRRLSHHIFCGRIQTVHKRWCSGSTFPKDFPPSSPKVAHYGFSSLSRSSFPEPPSGILMNSIFSLRTDPFAWASCPYRCSFDALCRSAIDRCLADHPRNMCIQGCAKPKDAIHL